MTVHEMVMDIEQDTVMDDMEVMRPLDEPMETKRSVKLASITPVQKFVFKPVEG